jgi:hypothetical protein
MMHDKSIELRALLADVGIKLDDHRQAPAARRKPPVSELDDRLDRDLIREILIAAGAQAHNVEWLTASCPSVAAAMGYVPPADRSV